MTMPQLIEAPHEVFWRQLAGCGVADMAELMDVERRTRADRVESAFRKGVTVDAKTAAGIGQLVFNRMWVGDDLEALNRELRDDLAVDLSTTKAHKEDPTVKPVYDLYCLSRNTRLISFYFCFGSQSSKFPGRLEPETESLLLELLWWRTMEKNDIAISRKSTWWMAGSENHDLNSKTTNLLVSAIFANEPDWASKTLPNKGYGCSPGYMSAGFNPASITDPSRKGSERANWADGKDYTAADHCTAWVGYLMDYLAERVKKGFFLENGSPGYMRYTVSYLLLIYNFCPDERLKERTRMFLDLFWADWALQQLGGLRGGPKTRHHATAGGYDAMSDWARFYLGGYGLTTANHMQQLIGDYVWSPLLWTLVLDREGLGSFAYIARGIGEEEQTCPRPAGVERTMMGDCESRMVKYSWVTPDYVLGTQMDHPLAVHNHLSAHGRWQGLVTSDVSSRIVTVSLSPFPGKTAAGGEYSLELMYHSVQDRQVLITQQSRRWMQINPDWFPTYDQLYDVDLGVYVGSGWHTRSEREGWLFLEQDDTYAAIRILRLKSDPDPMAFAKGTDRYADHIELEETSYSWNDDETIMRLVNKFSPIIIEAGRRADYPTLDDFQEKILANKLEIHQTVATHETRFILVYKGAEAEEIVFNAANPADVPMLGGAPINYRRSKTFDAPCLQSDYESGIVNIQRGEHRQMLDLNEQ